MTETDKTHALTLTLHLKNDAANALLRLVQANPQADASSAIAEAVVVYDALLRSEKTMQRRQAESDLIASVATA